MKQLIVPESVERALLFLAVCGPLVGVVVGTIVGAHEKRAAPKIIAGGLIGALGTVVYGMWHVYGAITSGLGLDSLTNLGLQLVLFAAFGAALGFAMFGIWQLMKRPERRG